MKIVCYSQVCAYGKVLKRSGKGNEFIEGRVFCRGDIETIVGMAYFSETIAVKFYDTRYYCYGRLLEWV